MKSYLLKFNSCYQKNSNNIVELEGFTIIKADNDFDIKSLLNDYYDLEGPRFVFGDLEYDLAYEYSNFDEYLDCFEIEEISDKDADFIKQTFLVYNQIFGSMPFDTQLSNEIEFAYENGTFDDD